MKVESTRRPDPMRYSVRVDASVDDWYEQGAIFQSANLNKRSVTLDLSTTRGRILLWAWPHSPMWLSKISRLG